MTTALIYVAAAALAAVGLLGGGHQLYLYSDTGLANTAVRHSEQCKSLLKFAIMLRNEEYQSMFNECQEKLNRSLKKLQDRGILDVDKCTPYSEFVDSMANCPIKGGGVLVVTSPAIVERVKAKKQNVKRSVNQNHGLIV